MKCGITLPDEARNCMFRMQIQSPFTINYGVKPNIMQRDYQSLWSKCTTPRTYKHQAIQLYKGITEEL